MYVSPSVHYWTLHKFSIQHFSSLLSTHLSRVNPSHHSNANCTPDNDFCTYSKLPMSPFSWAVLFPQSLNAHQSWSICYSLLHLPYMGGLVCVSWFPYKGRPVQMWSWLVCSSSPSRIWDGGWNWHSYRIQEQARRKVMWGVKGNTRRQCCEHCRQKAGLGLAAQNARAFTCWRHEHWEGRGRDSLLGCSVEVGAVWTGAPARRRKRHGWMTRCQSDKALTLRTEWRGTDTDNRVTRDWH